MRYINLRYIYTFLLTELKRVIIQVELYLAEHAVRPE